MNKGEASQESGGQQLAPWQNAIQKSKDRFLKIAQASVNYDKESVFAMQALMKNDFSMRTANNNPQSVHLAMINVASTGLTLNPANAYAYLVPRDGAIHLDISYKGLIKIATDAGAVVWARADLVREKDTFTYNGPAKAPEHQADAFRDRGEVIGVYCIAKTREGDVLTEIMPLDELEKIRSKSMAYARTDKHGNHIPSGPWVEWFEQMAKKAVIKRAAKTWPYSGDRDVIDQAIEIANEAEGGYQFDNVEANEDRRKLVHDAALGRHFPNVQAIKDHLSCDDPDMHAVAELWGEIPQDDQMALWLAPTKGGVFTTAERKAIKEGLPSAQSEE